ncbi:MAG: NAD(P)/FAD-dependent oxidoreductase, partial [Spirochaetota bacterium]
VKRIVIAGFGSAGYAALTALRRLGCRDEIIIIDPKDYGLLHSCGIPYAFEGKADPEKIRQTIDFAQMGAKKIQGYLRTISPKDRALHIDSAGKIISASYDALLLCTGSSPVIPPIPGIDRIMGNGLYTLANAGDLELLKEAAGRGTHGLVIGAGAIGLEGAAALITDISSATVIEKKDHILPGALDADMARDLQVKLERAGLSFRLNSCVEKILPCDKFCGVTAGGADIPADIGILAAGFRPRTDAASAAGIRTESLGIITDRHMRTSEEGIYAAGDCAVTVSVIDGRPITAKLATAAYRQGICAAHSMMGMDKEYRGSSGTFATKVAGYEIAGTGFTSSAARERGYDPVIAKITANILPDYFFTNDEITVKVIADKKTGILLGAQCFGRNGAAARINIISAAIENGLTPAQIESVEYAYCPAVSEIYDPLSRAIDGVLRRIIK